MEFTIKVNETAVKEDPDLLRFQEVFQGMMDRMCVSHFKYNGPGQKLRNVAPTIDELRCLRQRLAMYDPTGLADEGLCTCGRDPHGINCFLRLQKLNTGNTENLLDVANFAAIEFLFPAHKRKHFKAQTSQQSPGLAYKE
jgi:hypothetical protein